MARVLFQRIHWIRSRAAIACATGLVSAFALFGATFGLMGNAGAADPRSESASAQGTTYVRGELGYTLSFDSDVSGAPTSTVNLEGNWTGGAAVGHYLLPKLRLELNFGYNTNDVKSATGGFGTLGELNALTFFSSVYRDFLAFRNVRPFVGFGIGLARLRPDYALTGLGGAGPSDSDIKFAWQGSAGIAVDLNDRFAIETRYRYMRAGEYDFGPAAEGDYAHHTVLAGLRYTFGRDGRQITRRAPPQSTRAPVRNPEPPAPIATQPSLTGTEQEVGMVFFAFNSADLTAEARSTLDRIAPTLRRRGVRAVILEGHTDTSGNRAYNLRLARARAKSVREALVERGVSNRNISIVARGEQALRMKTADGVKAQLNRFVRVNAVYN